MPPDMSAAAAALWRTLAPELVKAGMLAGRDGGALETYCREYVRWRSLQKVADDEPLIETTSGKKANPAGVESRKLHKEIIQPLEIAIGLHYAARSRMRKPETGDADDPVEEELFGSH